MKKIYFASDQHFGAPTAELSFPREQKFVQWLDAVKTDAEAIFLLGDLFDFWFEYKTVVPKGFVRVLGKLAEIRDSGIPIYFFVGNHDLLSLSSNSFIIARSIPEELDMLKPEKSLLFDSDMGKFFIATNGKMSEIAHF